MKLCSSENVLLVGCKEEGKFMDSLLLILPAIMLMYLFVKYRKELKETYSKLTIIQLIGVFIAYLITIFIGFIFIYYVGNWLLGYITFKPLNIVVRVVIVILVLSFALNLLNKVLKKISNGVL